MSAPRSTAPTLSSKRVGMHSPEYCKAVAKSARGGFFCKKWGGKREREKARGGKDARGRQMRRRKREIAARERERARARRARTVSARHVAWHVSAEQVMLRRLGSASVVVGCFVRAFVLRKRARLHTCRGTHQPPVRTTHDPILVRREERVWKPPIAQASPHPPLFRNFGDPRQLHDPAHDAVDRRGVFVSFEHFNVPPS